MVKNHILMPLVKDGSCNIWLRKCTGSGKASEVRRYYNRFLFCSLK